MTTDEYIRKAKLIGYNLAEEDYPDASTRKKNSYIRQRGFLWLAGECAALAEENAALKETIRQLKQHASQGTTTETCTT